VKYGWVDKWGERPSVWPRPFCAYCGRALGHRQDVSEHLFTMSGAPFESGERIYFYWSHRTCNQFATPEQRMATFDAIKGMVKSP
jgi:hypothetical protein